MSSYKTIRDHAGLVDLKNWTRFEIFGLDAAEVLDETVGCNVLDLFEGRAVNTLIPSLTGGVDAIVWIITLEHSFLMISEPEDRNAIKNALESSIAGRDVTVKDVQEEKFALVLTGPEAEGIAEQAFGDDIYSIAFSNALMISSPTVIAARIGFFGEYELHLFGDISDKERVIKQIKRAAGEQNLVTDQAAFAVMMTEMRVMSRHRDVPVSTSVFEAGLHWMVDFRKEKFRGSDALQICKGTVKNKCVLMLAEGFVADIAEQKVFIDGVEIGFVQSAYWSDSIEKVVALAYINSEFGLPGLTCMIGVENINAETISAPAFLSKSVINSLN